MRGNFIKDRSLQPCETDKRRLEKIMKKSESDDSAWRRRRASLMTGDVVESTSAIVAAVPCVAYSAAARRRRQRRGWTRAGRALRQCRWLRWLARRIGSLCSQTHLSQYVCVRWAEASWRSHGAHGIQSRCALSRSLHQACFTLSSGSVEGLVQGAGRLPHLPGQACRGQEHACEKLNLEP